MNVERLNEKYSVPRFLVNPLVGIESLKVLVYLVFLLVNTPLYFLDPNTYLPKLVTWTVEFLAIVAILIFQNVKFRAAFILPLVILFIYVLAKFNGVERYTLSDTIYPQYLFVIIFMMAFFSTKNETALRATDLYIKLFSLMALPWVAIYLGVLFGFGPEYNLIHLGGREHFYRLYLGIGIIPDYEVLQFGNYTVGRFAGLFEESGMLGTLLGVLLVIDLVAFPEKKIRKVALASSGIITLSLAFYIFLFFIVLYLIVSAGRKTFVSAMIMVLVVGGLFLPQDLKSAVWSYVGDRLEITSSGRLKGDTRYDQYSAQYSEYLSHAGGIDLLIGHGAKSNTIDGQAQYSSYQTYIYEIGYFGFFAVTVMAAYFLLVGPIIHRKFAILILTVVPLMSIYQRPDALSVWYILLYNVMQRSFPFSLKRLGIR